MNISQQINLINENLPQTQCKRCGYDSCNDYASAIAGKEAEINLCIIGGIDGIKKLAQLLEMQLPLPAWKKEEEKPFSIAQIDENNCIGCNWCITACPVDAIIGARKHLHTVLTEYCNGCQRCAIACPMDCISFNNADNKMLSTIWSKERAAISKKRYEAKQARINRELNTNKNRFNNSNDSENNKRKKLIEAAILRAKQKTLNP